MKPSKVRALLEGSIIIVFTFAVETLVSEYMVWDTDSHHLRVIRATFLGVAIGLLVYMRRRIIHLKVDALTGLYCRLVVEEKLDDLGFASKDVSIGILDVNGLRNINNQFGHDEGDKLLREVAHRLRVQFRGKTRVTLARLGGDEFIVIAEAMSKRTLCQHLTECLSKPHGFGNWYIASAGVARSRNGKVRDAAKCADRAMYRAKTTGAGIALTYDCILDGIPDPVHRPRVRLRDQRGRSGGSEQW